MSKIRLDDLFDSLLVGAAAVASFMMIASVVLVIF